MRELVLVRHGETTGNSAIRLNGATDVPLSELGRRQAARAGRALAGEAFDRLVVSPMTRARQTGDEIAPGLAASAEVVPEFREVDFGDWETWTWEEVRVRDPAGYAAFQARGDDFHFPGGDRLSEFRRRVEAGARTALDGRPGRTLAALHKGVIKGVLRALLGWDEARVTGYPIDLGSIHRLRAGADGAWALVSKNEVAHLGEDRSHAH